MRILSLFQGLCLLDFCPHFCGGERGHMSWIIDKCVRLCSAPVMLLRAGSLWSWQRKYFMSCLIRWLSWKSKITWQPLPSSKEPSQTQLLFICIYTLAVAWHGWRGIWFALQCLDTAPVGEVGVEMGWATDLVFCLPLGSFSEFVTWHSSQPFEALSPKATNIEPPRPRRNHQGCYPPNPIQGSFLSADLHSLSNTHNRSNTYLLLQLFEGQLWKIPEGRWPNQKER